MKLRRLIVNLAPLVLYGLIAIMALYPLLSKAATHTGGEWTTDYYHFHWNYWWIRHALTTPGLNVYETNYVLYPATTNLAFHTLTPFWFPAWAALEPLFGGGRVGTLLAMDTIMVIEMTLTGWVFYLLLRREGVNRALALPFGAILQVSSGMMLAAMLTTINYLSGFWIPLNLLLWGEVSRARGRMRFVWAVLIGLSFYGTMMTDYQHMLFLAFLLVPYGVLTLIRQPDWNERVKLAAAGVVALAIMTFLLWIAGPLPYILSYDFAGLSPQPIENAGGIPFPNGFFSRFGTFDRGITLGSLLLPLVVVGIVVNMVMSRRGDSRTALFSPLPACVGEGSGVRGNVQMPSTDSKVEGSATQAGKLPFRASKWFWLAVMIVPLVLSAGAVVTVFGTQIDAPYAYLHRLLGGLFRSPARFDYAIIVAGLLFAGKALTPFVEKVTRTRGADGRGMPRPYNRLNSVLIAVPLLALVMVDSQIITNPMPVQPVTPDYDFYETIGTYQNERIVLEVPVAGGSGEAWVGDFEPMEAQFYGMIHGKPMLNGAIARAPLSSFWYWLYDDPMLAWLGQRRFIEPEVVEQQLRERIADWGLGWIVVHGDWIGVEREAFGEVIGWLNALPDDLVCLATVEGNTLFYETQVEPSACTDDYAEQDATGAYVLDIGSPDDLPHLGWGWHYTEDVGGLTLRWAGVRSDVTAYYNLPPGGYKMTLAAQAFYEPRTVQVRINDVLLEETAEIATDSINQYEFTVPAEAIGDGRDVQIALETDGVIRPVDFGLGEDTRSLSIAVDWIKFSCLNDSSSSSCSP